MEANVQLLAPVALPPGKDPLVPTHWMGGWKSSRAGLDTMVKRKLFCLCRESNSGPPTRSLVTVLTELSRLLTLDGVNLYFRTDVKDRSPPLFLTRDLKVNCWRRV